MSIHFGISWAVDLYTHRDLELQSIEIIATNSVYKQTELCVLSTTKLL